MVNGIMMVVIGILGYLFKEKLLSYQTYHNDETPIEIRRKRIEVITISLGILGVFIILSKIG